MKVEEILAKKIIRGREEEVENFREVKVKHMKKVTDLKVQFKIRENHNGRKNLLEEEVTTLEVAILITLGIIMVEKEKKILV